MSSKRLFALLPAFLLPAFSIACSGGGDGSSANAGTGGSTSGSGGSTSGSGGSTSGAGGSSGGGQCASGTLKLDGANNYSFASDIKLVPTKVKAKESNLTFDWSQVTTDFLGRTTSPTKDIDSVLLVILNLTVEQFEQHLNADDGMLKNFNQGALQLLTNNSMTSGNLQDFGVPTQPQNTYKTSSDVKQGVDDALDPAITDPTKTLLALMPSAGTDPGSGSKMIQVFTVDPASTTTSLTLGANARLAAGTNGHTGGTSGPSMSVSYDADIHSLTPIKLAAGDANVMIDWSALTQNGLGRAWLPRSITKLTVGHYTQSLTELENDFFDLETIPSAMYTAYVPSDQPISLSSLKEKTTSAAFTGIDDTGTWILALFCDPAYCGNPAPWFLTVLQTCK
jgi:hypothetical protein